MNAVMGKILWVDLTAGTCEDQKIPEKVYEKMLSGMGLAAYILYQRIPAGADPLGAENVLGFVSGLLTGTGSLMSGRWMAAAKSPLTHTWGDANCGGSLSPAIKQCGYDGIFFTGIAPRPVYLYVGHGKAELLDAEGVWGKDCRETEQALKAQYEGKAVSVACIGPAGEKLSLIAGISNDEGRMAARSGLGAVMGAKKLKALVLQGAHRIPVYDEARVKQLSEGFNRWISFQPPFLNGTLMGLLGTSMRWLPLQMRQDGLLYKVLLSKWGTVSMNQYSIETGDSPIKNWDGSCAEFNFKRSSSINPDRFRERELVKYHCYSCPLGCGGMCTIKKGSKEETHKPEYESVLAFGGMLMNEDLDSLFEINEKLNRAGMDSISAGGTVAFAFECYEKGLITRDDTGGLELTWGNTAAILKLLDLMIAREGIGDLLADGSRAAARRMQKQTEAYAVTAGGQELAMHDGRNDPGFALHAVVEPTPGRHTIGSYLYYEMFQLWTKVKRLPKVRWLFYPKGSKYTADREKAIWAAACSQFTDLINGCGLCLFAGLVGVNRLPIFEWLNAATGWNKTPEEYLQIGLNIHLVRQAFNAREGLDLKAPINERALGRPPASKGANRGRSVLLEELVPMYWKEMGLDEANGHPTAAAMAAIGLPELANAPVKAS